MMGYLLGIVVVVFGGVGLLVLLTLSLNKEVRAPSPQATQPQTSSQQESDWKKWGKLFGWIFFSFVVLDLWRKFVFPTVPVEWREWVPSFSWNTFEILAALAGVYFLWKKVGRKPKEITKTDGGKKSECEKESTAGRDIALMLVFLALSLFLAFPGVRPEQNIVPVAPAGMLYVPLYGVILALSWIAFVSLLWSVLDDVDNTALYFPISWILLIFGFWFGLSHDLFVPIHLDPNIEFSPIFNDITMGWGAAILGAFLLYCFLALFIIERDETRWIIIITLFVLWIPQVAPGFAH